MNACRAGISNALTTPRKAARAATCHTATVRLLPLGTPRERGEGLRIGTVRRPPRGVRKEQYAARDFFDVWLPDLAPSQALVRWVMAAPLTPKRWAAFSRRYRQEMRQPAARRLLALLAALSAEPHFSVGC